MDVERARDLEFLGLAPDADDAEIIVACKSRVALYQENNLATYSLLEPEERRRLLVRIDSILLRVKSGRSEREAAVEAPLPASPASAAVLTIGPGANAAEEEPDPVEDPGPYLMYRRKLCGLELEEIARETKISVGRLRAIEAENAGVLPAPVFVRGFVIAVARMLGMDEAERFAGQYLEKIEEGPRGLNPE